MSRKTKREKELELQLAQAILDSQKIVENYEFQIKSSKICFKIDKAYQSIKHFFYYNDLSIPLCVLLLMYTISSFVTGIVYYDDYKSCEPKSYIAKYNPIHRVVCELFKPRNFNGDK